VFAHPAADAGVDDVADLPGGGVHEVLPRRHAVRRRVDANDLIARGVEGLSARDAESRHRLVEDEDAAVRRPSGRGGRKARPRLRHLVQTMSDRKSTRLNSSHVSISYAVFCLKKKLYEGIRV